MIQHIYSCTQFDHENEPITGFCLNESCKENKRSCCSLCFQNKHKDHCGDCKTFQKIQPDIQKNVQKIKFWDRQAQDSFNTIEKISCDTESFLFEEEKFLIELENNLLKLNYEVNLHDLLKLKSWNDIISSYIHQLDGDFLEVCLLKIDCLTETIFKNKNSLDRIKEINSQQTAEQQIHQIRMQNDNRKVDEWIRYGTLLKDLIQCDQERRQQDIKLIHLITKTQKQIISQWGLKIKRAFELIKQIKNRWAQFVQNMIQLQIYFNQEDYKAFDKHFNDSCYCKVDCIQNNLNFQLLGGIIKKLTILFEALQQLQTTYEKKNQVLNPLIQSNDQLNENVLQSDNQINQSNHSIRVLEVANTKRCKKRGHENEPIVGFCLFIGCKKKQKCCGQCWVNDHQEHQEGLKTIFQTKQYVEGQLSEIIQWFSKVLDSFQSIKRVSKNIEATLVSQKTKLIQLLDKNKQSTKKFQLNNIKLLRRWNLIIQQNLHHLENFSLQNLLKKISIIFQALLTFEATQNNQAFQQLFENQESLEDFYNNKLYENFVLISQQKNLNAQIYFYSSGLLITRQKKEIFIDEIKTIILTYIQLIQDCLKRIHISPQLSLIERNSVKYYSILKDKITLLQNNELNIDLLNKQIQFTDRFGIIIRQFFEKIVCFSGRLNSFEEILGMQKRSIVIKNGEIFYCNQNFTEPDENQSLNNNRFQLHQDNSLLRDLNKILKLNQLRLLAQHSDEVFKKGVLLNEQQQYSQAVIQFNEMIEMNPLCPDAYIQKGIALFNQGRMDDAIVEYDKALSLNPQISLTFFNKGKLKIDLGRALENQNKWEQARENYDKAIKLNPHDFNSYQNRGQILQKLGDHKGALKDFDQAIKLNPNNYKSYNQKGGNLTILGYALQILERNEEAVESFKEAIKLNPNDFNSYYNKAQSLQKLGLDNQAIQDYEQAIKLNPNDYNSYYNKAQSLQKLGKDKEAIQDYGQAIKLNPNDFNSYYNKAQSLQKLGLDNQAIQDYEQAIKLNPNDFNSHYNKAKLLQKQGLVKQAIQHYGHATKLNPNDYNSLFNKGQNKQILGQALQNLNQYKEAAEDYGKAIKLNPKNFDLQYNLGVVLYQLNRNDEASKHLEKAIELNPNNYEAYCYNGLALSEQQRYEESLKYYNHAIRLNPQQQDAYFNKGIALKRMCRYEDSIQWLNQAIQRNPSNETAYVCIGQNLHQLKRYEEAIQYNNRAIKLNPKFAVAYNNNGTALTFLGRNREAIEYFNKALDINPNNQQYIENKGKLKFLFQFKHQKIQVEMMKPNSFYKGMKLEKEQPDFLIIKKWIDISFNFKKFLPLILRLFPKLNYFQALLFNFIKLIFNT